MCYVIVHTRMFWRLSTISPVQMHKNSPQEPSPFPYVRKEGIKRMRLHDSMQEMHLFIFPRTSSLFLYARYIACDVMRMRCASLPLPICRWWEQKNKRGNKCTPFFLPCTVYIISPFLKERKWLHFYWNCVQEVMCAQFLNTWKKGRFYSGKWAHPW